MDAPAVGLADVLSTIKVVRADLWDADDDGSGDREEHLLIAIRLDLEASAAPRSGA